MPRPRNTYEGKPCIRCGGTERGLNRETCANCARIYAAKWTARIKVFVRGLYGARCVCCGLTDVATLQLHHVNHDGWKERAITGFGFNFYYSLYKQYLLDGIVRADLELLCANCHRRKDAYGECFCKEGGYGLAARNWLQGSSFVPALHC